MNEGGTCPKLEHIDMDTTEDDLTGLASEAGPAVPAAVARKGKSRAVVRVNQSAFFHFFFILFLHTFSSYFVASKEGRMCVHRRCVV